MKSPDATAIHHPQANPERPPAPMRRPLSRALLATLLLFGVGAIVGPAGAGADILVLRDGSRIETQGKWEVKGRQLVFKTATGTLSAIRAVEADLPASEKATAEALAPKDAEAPKAEAKKPVLVLTNKDVGRASGEDVAAADGGAPAADGKGKGGKVEVVSSSLDTGEGEDAAYRVRGTVRNNSAVAVTDLSILVVATVSRGDDHRRTYCEASIGGPLAPSAVAEFNCSISRQDVFATGMAEQFAEAKLSFEVRSNPQAPPATANPKD